MPSARSSTPAPAVDHREPDHPARFPTATERAALVALTDLERANLEQDRYELRSGWLPAARLLVAHDPRHADRVLDTLATASHVSLDIRRSHGDIIALADALEAARPAHAGPWCARALLTDDPAPRRQDTQIRRILLGCVLAIGGMRDPEALMKATLAWSDAEMRVESPADADDMTRMVPAAIAIWLGSAAPEAVHAFRHGTGWRFDQISGLITMAARPPLAALAAWADDP